MFRRHPPSLLFLLLCFFSWGPRFSSSFSVAELWGLRAASAVTTYVGLVGFLDGARGRLNSQVAPLLKIAPSQVEGAGLGLFLTTEILRKGTVLGTYPGAVIPLDQGIVKLEQFPQIESYIWRFSDSKFVIDPTDGEGNIQDICVGGNPTAFGSLFLCKTVLAPFLQRPTTLCRINEPPKGRDVNVVTDEDLNQRTVTFLLGRDVYPDEELFLDYGPSYDRSNYGGKTRDPTVM